MKSEPDVRPPEDDALRQALIDKHKGDPAYDRLHTIGAIRWQELRDKEEDEMQRGWK